MRLRPRLEVERGEHHGAVLANEFLHDVNDGIHATFDAAKGFVRSMHNDCVALDVNLSKAFEQVLFG